MTRIGQRESLGWCTTTPSQGQPVGPTNGQKGDLITIHGSNLIMLETCIRSLVYHMGMSL